MCIEIFSRLLNLLAISFLIYGFTVDCFYLYLGTFLVIFSEITLYICLYNVINEINFIKSDKNRLI